MGSFFDFRPTEGAYEANPPFVRGVILKMAKHMEDLLQVPTCLPSILLLLSFRRCCPCRYRWRCRRRCCPACLLAICVLYSVTDLILIGTGINVLNL